MHAVVGMIQWCGCAVVGIGSGVGALGLVFWRGGCTVVDGSVGWVHCGW